MNLIGQKFGMLTVKELAVAKPYSQKSWLCICDCGNTCIRLETSLKVSQRDGHISSCGCLPKQNLTAGDTKRCIKAGLHRKDTFVNGCNIQMTFREGTISTNSSGTQGISYSKNNNKWHVYIGYKNYRANLGYFEDINDAIKIRKLAEEAIKNNTFEDFYFELRGKSITDTQQYKKESRHEK